MLHWDGSWTAGSQCLRDVAQQEIAMLVISLHNSNKLTAVNNLNFHSPLKANTQEIEGRWGRAHRIA
jgi:hypothetical protein